VKSILALDLGSTFGWATIKNGELCAGSQLLVPKGVMDDARKLRADRRCDPRVIAFSEWLRVLPPFDIILFEDVQFQTSTAQAQLWSSFRAAVWIRCCALARHLDCVPVGTLKLWAAGHGGATKEAMAAALIRRMPERFCHPQGKHTKHETIWDARTKKNLDDNSVDGILLALWAKQHIRL
jgi:hypothetical protein